MFSQKKTFGRYIFCLLQLETTYENGAVGFIHLEARAIWYRI